MQRSDQLSVEIRINEKTVAKELINVKKIVSVSHRIGERPTMEVIC